MSRRAFDHPVAPVNWDPIDLRFRPRLEQVIRTIAERHPGIDGRVEDWRSPYMRFNLMATFSHDRTRQEHEDLIISLRCSPSRKELWNSEKVFVFPADRDAIGLEMERGTGLTLAPLDPVLLPADRDSIAYEEAVVDYVGRAEEFLQDQMAMILDIVATPFEP